MNKKVAKKVLKVAFCTRFITHYRVPIISRLNGYEDINIKAFYSTGFPGRRCDNTKKITGFEHEQLKTLRTTINSSGREGIIIINPELFCKLYKYKPDVIFAEGANFFNNLLFIFPFAKIFKIPIIWHTSGKLENHNYYGISKLYRKMFKFMEKRSDIFLSYSSLGLKYAKRIGLPRKKCVLAVNNIDTEKVKNEQERCKNRVPELRKKLKLENKKIVLFVGAIEKDKDLDILLEAFKYICINKPSAHLLIVGDGTEMSDIRKRIKDLGISNSVTTTGKIIDGVSTYFQLSDIFVLPGRGGLAIPEAMLHGLPVICGIADGTEWDYVIDGVTGFRIREINRADRIKALEIYILRLLENLSLCKTISKETINIIRDKYNIHTFVDSIHHAIWAPFLKD
ncbi:MAG: glycosyltransferase [Parcubacteria group bacterium]|nr:glycosyltransferase [Parcubacteria group bacterium]